MTESPTLKARSSGEGTPGSVQRLPHGGDDIKIQFPQFAYFVLAVLLIFATPVLWIVDYDRRIAKTQEDVAATRMNVRAAVIKADEAKSLAVQYHDQNANLIKDSSSKLDRVDQNVRTFTDERRKATERIGEKIDRNSRSISHIERLLSKKADK